MKNGPSHRPKLAFSKVCCRKSTQPVNNLGTDELCVDKHRKSLAIRADRGRPRVLPSALGERQSMPTMAAMSRFGAGSSVHSPEPCERCRRGPEPAIGAGTTHRVAFPVSPRLERMERMELLASEFVELRVAGPLPISVLTGTRTCDHRHPQRGNGDIHLQRLEQRPLRPVRCSLQFFRRLGQDVFVQAIFVDETLAWQRAAEAAYSVVCFAADIRQVEHHGARGRE
jgi:hypothetical protein